MPKQLREVNTYTCVIYSTVGQQRFCMLVLLVSRQ